MISYWLRYPSRVLLLAAVIVSSLSAQSQDSLSLDSLDLISLPVRVHIIQSERLPKLDADIQQDQLNQMFEQANLVWRQAGIEWVIERRLELSASFETAYARAADPKSQLKPAQRLNIINAVCSYQEPLAAGWNLCIVGRFANGAGGAFFPNTNRKTPSLIWPLEDQLGSFNAATLAHEMGHSLGLPHASRKPNNLMTGGGNNMRRKAGSLDQIILTAEEIQLARHQALTGSAATSIHEAEAD